MNNKKRIITCSDGTWNKPKNTDRGQIVPTNVALMYKAIKSIENEQVKVYDTGVGSSFSLKEQIWGGITGHGIDNKIKNMYLFIMLNYCIGDEIYLFGFSRGAYTARSLGGFIRNCGILKPENINLLDKAYELYRDRNEYSKPDSDLMKSFRANYCFEDITPIHFIGVWDTVGSLGIPMPWYKRLNIEKYKFHDVTLSSTIVNAYHALAVDERRALFNNASWVRSKTVQNDPNNRQKLEQRWFPGVHSNIGGGYIDQGLSNQALLWLINKAKEVGLVFDEEYVNQIKPNPMGELRNSRTGIHKIFKQIWRHIPEENDGHVVDESVYERMKKDSNYRPKNIEKTKD